MGIAMRCLHISATGAAIAVAPSPLAGEGCSVFQRKRMGEGGLRANCVVAQKKPLTHHDSLRRLRALSREGRGHKWREPETAARLNDELL